MRIAVIGSTGLIGRAVAAGLKARGDGVLEVARTPGGEPPDAIRWDGRSELPPGAFAGCDAVVNMAGAPIARRWSDAIKEEIIASRVDLTARVVRAVVHAAVPTLVNGSAVGFYGSGEAPVDETSPRGDGFLAELCEQWEAAALAATAQGVRVVVVRTGVVLANDGGALPQMLPAARLGAGGPIAGGKQWFPWIHIDDEVGLILRAIDDAEFRGPINAVAPGIVRQGEFAHALGAALHRPAFVPTPGFAIKALLGEGAQVVTRGQQVLPRVATEAGYAFRYPELPAALASLV